MLVNLTNLIIKDLSIYISQDHFKYSAEGSPMKNMKILFFKILVTNKLVKFLNKKKHIHQ